MCATQEQVSCKNFHFQIATLAQLVERATSNREAGGSTPPCGFFYSLTGATVAYLPTEQEVMGSNPMLGFY